MHTGLPPPGAAPLLTAFCHLQQCRTFQQRLREIREYHRRYPHLEVTLGEAEDSVRPAEPRIEFSGEESGGRCLDLHALFLRFTNAKFGQQKMDYAEYVSNIADFDKIQRGLRSPQPYRSSQCLCLRMSQHSARQRPAGLQRQGWLKSANRVMHGVLTMMMLFGCVLVAAREARLLGRMKSQRTFSLGQLSGGAVAASLRT